MPILKWLTAEHRRGLPNVVLSGQRDLRARSDTTAATHSTHSATAWL